MNWRVLGDWGTSRLRLFRVEGGRVLDRAEGPGALAPQPDAALRAALAPWLAASRPDFIHLSGMAGARTGLREAAYVECPAGVSEWRRAALRFAFDTIPLVIAPGAACTHDTGAPDVMRGEETQIFGACVLEPLLAHGVHLLLLPGTHSKWAQLDNGRIISFRTFVTGELFALLRQSSLLPATEASDPAQEQDGFDAGLARASSGLGVIGALFEARAGQLRAERSPSWAHGFISGLLIGAEVVEMAAQRLPPTVVLIGAPDLTMRYEIALSRLGVGTQRLDGDACVLAGLGLLSC